LFLQFLQKDKFLSNQTIQLDQQLYEYLLSVSLRESQVLKDLRVATAALPGANMQIAPEQGQFMALLVKIMGATRLIEIGTYTGYSTLVCALALSDGKIIAIDSDRASTEIAHDFWQQAKVDHLIDLRIGDAQDTLQSLLRENSLKGAIDFVFIDADKVNYSIYYELSLELLRKNGIILFDNVLWGGAVADKENNDRNTTAIRNLNLELLDDPRVDISLVPIGDGLTIARKK
jgi:predicted O-methyltransferase YrrM|tara:strand:+ start:127 stop:822 length:696 start_codon:yes stop_codon:yes gene_type:complete